MPDTQWDDLLAATRHVVVLLRLTVGTGGRVLYGEVVDPDTRKGLPFHGLVELPTVLRRWLEVAGPPGEDHSTDTDEGDRPDDRAVDPTTEN